MSHHKKLEFFNKVALVVRTEQRLHYWGCSWKLNSKVARTILWKVDVCDSMDGKCPIKVQTFEHLPFVAGWGYLGDVALWEKVQSLRV